MPRVFVPAISFAFLLLAEIPLSAQYPGQYPPGQYPPGQYPPGQYPPSGGTGIPFPRRGKKSSKTTSADTPSNLQQVTGTLRSLDDKSIVMTADDSRNINFKRTANTKFLKKEEEMKPTALKPGDHVMVEASQDDEGYMTAVRVNFEKEGTAQEREKASAPVPIINTASSRSRGDDDDRPILRRKDSPPPVEASSTEQPAKKTASEPAAERAAERAAEPVEPPERANVPVVESDVPIDESDPGAPRLRHGKTTSRKPPGPTTQVASNTPHKADDRAAAGVPPDSASSKRDIASDVAPRVDPKARWDPKVDPRIEKTRIAVANFTQALPNYVCQEQIARFVNTSAKVNWQPVDVVSAEVVYENHKEIYRNLAINGKPVKKGMEELSGSWSTGEFGTVLVDLFSPSTAADFRYRRQAKSAGRDAYLFAFEVERENSHWHVQVASQSVLPAYKGSVWIDKETSQVLRIEMESVQIPKDFPMDKVESATDYQFVRLGDREYLLPVHSEVLSCQRGSSDCSRNAIDFRNYHKYSGESTITFENK